MSITLGRVEELAPDQASLSAARKLLRPGDWPVLASDAEGYAWGECQGSGATPYRVMICEGDAGYKCTCPSRKFPCKHSLALMWMRAEGKLAFADSARPQWVDDWIGRRRGPSGNMAEAEAAKPRISLAEAADENTETPDPKAQERAQAARERNRAAREASILAGLEELDRWLLDQIETGIFGFSARAMEKCRTLAQRLVDAKAGGLASRIERLPSDILALPETMRDDHVLASLAQWRLMAEAYRRQASLPPMMRADLRIAMGWNLTRDDLLADPDAVRLHARWMVVATVGETQPDRMRRIETWLMRLESMQAPHFAVLIDFVPLAGSATGSVYSPGDVLDAELVFYPSATPLRALIAKQHSQHEGGDESLPVSGDLHAALAARDEALTKTPWLERWPLAATSARIRFAANRTYLTDDTGALALPIRPRADDADATLIGIEPCNVFGLWDGRFFDLALVDTPLGRWVTP